MKHPEHGRPGSTRSGSVASRTVEFPSPAGVVGAFLYMPDNATGPAPLVIHCPGWTGTMDSDRYSRWDRRLADAGFAVLAFDYCGRGLSRSSPPTRTISSQLDQLRAAVACGRQLEGVDSQRLGILGSGGPGGSHPLLVAAEADGVGALVCQYPIASGRRWLQHRLPGNSLTLLLRALDDDRQRRQSGKAGRVVSLAALRDFHRFWTELDAPPPDADTPVEVFEDLLEYEPVLSAPLVTAPTLLVGVEDDAVTPTEQILEIYRQLPGDRHLLLFDDVSHHAAYDERFEPFMAATVAWFERHLAHHTDDARSGHARPGEIT